MAISDHHIAIIGGGIAGLTAAIALVQTGAQVELFEVAPEFDEIGAGLQISANALVVLDVLGVDVADVATKPDNLELRHFKSGKVIARLRQNAVDLPNYYLMHRADLVAKLSERVRELGVTCHMNTTAEVTRAPNMRPSVHYGNQHQQFDLVVGADGVKSRVRGAAAGHSEPRFTGQAAWRALVPTDQFPAPLRHTGTRVYIGPNRHLVCYTLRGGSMMNIVAVQEQSDWIAEGWSIPDHVQNLQAAFADWHDDVTALLAPVTSTMKWGLFDHAPLDQWSRDGVVLIGDAAHPMLPFMAQGAAMGIEDAYVLAKMLSENDITNALQLFEAKRKFRTTRIQQTAARNGKIFHLSNPITRNTVQFGLRLASALFPKLLENMTNFIYCYDVTDGSNV